jgi:dihydroorotate dehydrogenase
LIYRTLFQLVLRRFDAERVHVLVAATMRTLCALPLVGGTLRRLLAPRDPALEVEALGLTFPSPLGVAAGLDKDATWFDALGDLGFGFVEVGTVTAHGQSGNPRPRVHRLPRDRALLNSMGFPNEGAEAVAERLRRRDGRTIVGVNVGKAKDVAVEDAVDDYRASVRLLAPHADYLVVNVSSPNTPGLRSMQAVEALRPLVRAVQAELEALGVAPPLLVKIAPDLLDAEIDAVADLALELDLAGIVAVNTTTDFGVLEHSADAASAIGRGGVSGAPLASRSLEVLRRLRERVGDDLVLISVGGVMTPGDARDRLRAGATLVQAYTGLVYGGPLWPRRVSRALAREPLT